MLVWAISSNLSPAALERLAQWASVFLHKWWRYIWWFHLRLWYVSISWKALFDSVRLAICMKHGTWNLWNMEEGQGRKVSAALKPVQNVPLLNMSPACFAISETELSSNVWRNLVEWTHSCINSKKSQLHTVEHASVSPWVDRYKRNVCESVRRLYACRVNVWLRHLRSLRLAQFSPQDTRSDSCLCIAASSSDEGLWKVTLAWKTWGARMGSYTY